MATEWLYAKGNQQLGPVSTPELKALVESGQLNPTDLVWKDGMAEWVPAKRIKGLFPVAPATAQQPPPLPQTLEPASFDFIGTPPTTSTPIQGKGMSPKRLLVLMIAGLPMFLCFLCLLGLVISPKDPQESSNVDATDSGGNSRENLQDAKDSGIKGRENVQPIQPIPMDLTSPRGVRVGNYFSRDELKRIAVKIQRTNIPRGCPESLLVNELGIGTPTIVTRIDGFSISTPEAKEALMTNPNIPTSTINHMLKRRSTFMWLCKDNTDDFIAIGFTDTFLNEKEAIDIHLR